MECAQSQCAEGGICFTEHNGTPCSASNCGDFVLTRGYPPMIIPPARRGAWTCAETRGRNVDARRAPLTAHTCFAGGRPPGDSCHCGHWQAPSECAGRGIAGRAPTAVGVAEVNLAFAEVAQGSFQESCGCQSHAENF